MTALTRTASRTFALTAIAGVLGLAACEKAPGTEQPVAPDRADAQPADVVYSCEGGKSLVARYPDARTAIVTFGGQTTTLQLAESASGSRFIGGGREWWIKAYPDREEGTLSPSPTGAAAGGPPLAVCRKGATADVSASAPTDFNASLPPKEQGAQPAVGAANEGQGPAAGSPTAAPVSTGAPPCRSGDLSLRRVGEDAGAGNRAVTYALVNNGRQACSLKGFPTLSWQDEQGRALQGVRVIQSEATMFESSGPPVEVPLPAGGRAIFHISYSAVQPGPKACPASARLQATPPENSQILEIDDRIQPCTGQVRVGPVRVDRGDSV